MITILVVVGVVLAMAAVPVAFMLGASSIAAIIFGGHSLPLALLAGRQLDEINNFTFVAIPLFVMAGELMNRGGLSIRLIRFAEACFGWIPGGLAVSVICATVLFSGTIGSKLGEAAAMGATVFPGLETAGYSRPYSVALVASASAMGELVPPAVLMIILAPLASQSVAGLFAASLVPALVMAACIFGLVVFQAKSHGVSERVPFSVGAVFRTLIPAIPALLVPVVIFGGIFSGLATPTEAGALAVLAALLSTAIYRELPLRAIPGVFIDASVAGAGIVFVLGVASIISYLLAIANVPNAVGALMLGISHSPIVFMCMACGIFIILGSILEGLPAVIIFLPVFLPVLGPLGIPPLQFLVAVVASVGIGLFLPPFGVGTAMLSSIAKVRLGEVMRPTAAFIAIEVVALAIIIALPQVSLVLPRLIGR